MFYLNKYSLMLFRTARPGFDRHSQHGGHGAECPFPSIVLMSLPRDHEYVNCRRDITEILLNTATADPS